MVPIDKILVFGDSITYGKWDSEGGWVARLRKHIDAEFNLGKEGNVQVYNLGTPGEVTTTLVKRVEAELAARLIDREKDLSILTIFAIGINDSCPNNWLTEKQTPEAEFKDAIQNMIDIAKKAGCKIVFVGLTPVDTSKFKRLKFSNEEVKKYDGFVTEVCSKNGVKKIELFDELLKENFAQYLSDSVHPNAEGHKVLFEKILPHIL